MNQLINSRWTKLTLPYKLSYPHCTIAFPVSPNYLFLINPKEKEMFLVQAIINNPQLKSLGKYEWNKEPWSEKGVDELTGRHWYKYHKGWEFNSETLILSLENDQREKCTYKLDIPSFENAQLIKITPENESLINKELVCNIQRGSNFGRCKAIDSFIDGRVTGYEGLSLETNEFIQSKQVHVNCGAYVDGDYILVPKSSGEDAFYGGLDLYKKNGNHVQSIDFEEIPYVEVQKGQGIIFEADESGQNAKSAIYFCIEFTEYEYEPHPVLEYVVNQKDAFESIFFWGLPDQCP
jgi:hypothetical protein